MADHSKADAVIKRCQEFSFRWFEPKNERTQEYHSLVRSGEAFAVGDHVTVYLSDGLIAVGLICRLWEDSEGRMWSTVRWYVGHHEVECPCLGYEHDLDHEIFLTDAYNDVLVLAFRLKCAVFTEEQVKRLVASNRDWPLHAEEFYCRSFYSLRRKRFFPLGPVDSDNEETTVPASSRKESKALRAGEEEQGLEHEASLLSPTARSESSPGSVPTVASPPPPPPTSSSPSSQRSQAARSEGSTPKPKTVKSVFLKYPEQYLETVAGRRCSICEKKVDICFPGIHPHDELPASEQELRCTHVVCRGCLYLRFKITGDLWNKGTNFTCPMCRENCGCHECEEYIRSKAPRQTAMPNTVKADCMKVLKVLASYDQERRLGVDFETPEEKLRAGQYASAREFVDEMNQLLEDGYEAKQGSHTPAAVTVSYLRNSLRSLITEYLPQLAQQSNPQVTPPTQGSEPKPEPPS